MTDLLAARLQMALSLGFHIIFAAIGVAMPVLMATSYREYLRTGNAEAKQLTKAWSKGVAIFFAVGAVSGTALSFELGLLWPGFMKYAGPIIGMPFSWEGTAFFLEAIALGIFLYGWDKLQPKLHWLSAVAVGIAGITSAMFVICANGWMNSPAGFTWNGGQPTDVDPWAAMFNDAAFLQGLHMVIASFQAVGCAVAGCHAWLYLKRKHRIHEKGLKIAFVVAAFSSIAQPILGDLSAKSVAKRQPAKLAAMEAHFETSRGAPLLLGGLPDEVAGETRYAIKVPKMLSMLAYGDFEAEVKGLNDFPATERPPVAVTHIAFQIMVAIGTLLAGVGVIGLWLLKYRPKGFMNPLWLKILVFLTPTGFIAIEAGWIVTEVGRQPWIIYGYLRTADALTRRPGVTYTLALYAALYSILTIVVAVLLTRQFSLLDRDLSTSDSAKE
ncbi:MAG: cytochrome ubiquinol oxidase subunit I [Deltaproteobacteria bacterium]|nr:cytochrome ubiquinol oxidase subunit I [Deltaproteobacteria bacterium]